MTGKVSIIVPVYNGIPYLEQCLSSVAAQTYKDIEVIIINDGSTDESEKIIIDFTKKDKRFNLFTQENHGLGYTRNRGISLSQGEYIFFLDADDVIPANAINSLVSAIEKEQADFAAGKVVRFNKNRKYIPPRHLEFGLYTANKSTTIQESPELLQDSIACNKLWRTNLIKKHELSFKENKYYEDLGFTLRAALLAKKIAVIKDTVYHWRVREGEDQPSITQQQMTLVNTSDRLEALMENRDWLIQQQVVKEILDEHDLKSLFDVVRLHVSKFALINKYDLEKWKEEVVSFLKLIPPNVAERLPEKEFALYKLLMSNDEENLKLFSEMLTNTETIPIVKQMSEGFFLQGHQGNYDVNRYLKLNMNISEIKKSKQYWKIEGVLTIPKASETTEGELVIRGRTNGEELVVEDVNTQPLSGNLVYKHQEQRLEAIINTESLKLLKKDKIYDFYYRLKGYPEYNIGRVRLYNENTEPINIKLDGINFSLYKSNFGNLSLKIENQTDQMKVLFKKFGKMLRK